MSGSTSSPRRIGALRPNIRVLDKLTTNSYPWCELFREADLFVLPTRADSHSIATLEAMATGHPVISTPVGGVPMSSGRGRPGTWFPRTTSRRLPIASGGCGAIRICA